LEENTIEFERGKRNALTDAIVGILFFIAVDDEKEISKLTLRQIKQALRNITKCSNCKTIDEILNIAIFDFNEFNEVYEKANMDAKVEIASEAILANIINLNFISKITKLDIEDIKKIEAKVNKDKYLA